MEGMENYFAYSCSQRQTLFSS
nr:hypothetical protein L204_06514 [Cryptococcus depauperatus CBS 7855]